VEAPQMTGLVKSPRSEGLYKAIIDRSGYWVSDAAWLRARAAREVIGTCRQCGEGYLMANPSPPEHHLVGDESKLSWYEATCQTCGHEVALPNGKVLRESSRNREIPGTWWKNRNAAIKGRE
jgi:hypothetical protein